MNPFEEATIRAFIAPSRRARWIESLASLNRRAKFLDRLNHCRDFDDRYCTSLAATSDTFAVLTARGAPGYCHVISDAPELDGRELPLRDALAESELAGWGSLFCCKPGQLAYYYGEHGEVRLLLERSRI